MSVLSCNRRGCGNVMCDRYSHRYGYICDDCFGQLCRMPLGDGTGDDIGDFMDDHREPCRDLTEFYKEEFPVR